MIEFFCCVTDDNKDQATVAVTSFVRNNPGTPVRLFYESPSAISKFDWMGVVTATRVASPYLLMSAIDYYDNQHIVDRIVHLGANTLTQGSVESLTHVDMSDSVIGGTSIMRFGFMMELIAAYERNEPSLMRLQDVINPRYFDHEVLLFNLPELTKNRTHGFLYGFMESRTDNEGEYLNLLLRDDNILIFPPDINAPIETVIPSDLSNRLLMKHCTALKSARLVRFPGTVTPWTRCEFNKLTMQFPMNEYLSAVRLCDGRLSPEFVSIVEENTARANVYLGKLPDFWL